MRLRRHAERRMARRAVEPGRHGVQPGEVDDALDLGDTAGSMTATRMKSISSFSISFLRSQIELKTSPMAIGTGECCRRNLSAS